VADFLLILPILLLSVVAHEYAHAWTAYKQGDDTALAMGRLTLNPIPHIDLFSSILLPVMLWFATKGAFTFGSAKPVPINPAKFKHYVRGDIIVSTAGVAMNLLIAIACAGLFVVFGIVGKAAGADVFRTLQYMAGVGIGLNVLLAIFNLIPLPPLDGSHLLYHALPSRLAAGYRRFGRYGFMVLLLSFWLLPGMWDVLLTPVDVLTRHTMAILQPWSLGPLH
jgi:Zn-dependent protease